jgi:hypothetical protein
MTIDQYVDRGLDLMLRPVVTARGERGYAQVAEAVQKSRPPQRYGARRAKKPDRAAA